ncbi:MAG: proprotein convertase P-domain-containing protein [Phycisphaerales bacterium]
MNSMQCVRLAGCAIGLIAASAVAGPSKDGPSEQQKTIDQIIDKGDGSVDARREMANEIFGQTRGPLPTERVIYGADDRREVYEYDVLDPTLRQMAEAAAVVVSASSVFDNGDGTYTLATSPWTSAGGGTLCPEEPFRGQPQVGFCSSFLVGPDIITTAGHCVDSFDISNGVAFVFGFQLNDEDETGPMIVPADWVYFGTAIIDQSLAGDDDHSVVQLDRPVTGITPVPIRRTGVVPVGTPLAVVGHPAAILKKIAGGAEVKANQTGYFQSNLDTYGGNSGSMVINLNTYEVEGILVRGAPDYTTSGGCVVSNQVPDTGNTGGGLPFEECSVTTTFESFIPPLGITVSPGGVTTHYGVVGGPFTEPSVVYTLDNTTSDPANYTVSMSNPAAGVLIDGGTSDLSGSIPGNSSAMVTVTLDNAIVNAHPAGVFSTGITFTDTTNSIASTATHNVEVGQTLVTVDPQTPLIGGGPVGGPFPGSVTYTITSERPTPVDVMVDGPDWLDFGFTRTSDTVSLNGEGDFANLTVSFGGTADTLAAGLYQDNLTFTNLDNGDTTVVPVAIDVGRFIYNATDVPINITDNATFQSTLTVTESFCIGDVDVDLDLNHTFSGDLIITLTSPQGTSVTLHNEGGGSDDFTPRRYDDDDAANFLAEGPGMLADFEFEIVTGVWTLTVEDDAGGDQGTLNAWQLRVASSGDTCPPDAPDFDLVVDENQAAAATLSASAIDPIDTFTITSLPSSGVLWDGTTAVLSVPHDLSGNTVTYRATPTLTGSDAFTYTATAGGLTSPNATASVFIDSVSGPATLHEFDMDTDPMWTTEGLWAWGVPAGLGGGGFSGPDPTSGFTGANVYGYNLNGNYTDNMPETNLTSDALDVSGNAQVVVSFRRWLGMESSTFDDAAFRVSVDGGPFQDVWVHSGGSFGDDAWTFQSYDITGIAGGASTITLRWVMGATDGSVTYPGWNLDDIEVGGDNILANPADLDGNLALNVDDIDAFVSAFLGSDCLADMNGTGTLNVDDIDAFVDYFLNGP